LLIKFLNFIYVAIVILNLVEKKQHDSHIKLLHLMRIVFIFDRKSYINDLLTVTIIIFHEQQFVNLAISRDY